MSRLRRNYTYTVGDIVNALPNYTLTCTKAGTTSTDPITVQEGTIIDGTCEWNCVNNVGGGSGGGSGTGNYRQMVAMNVTAPKTYEIKIAETTDFCFPPVEVLKFKTGQTDVVVDALTFDLADGKLFEVEGISSENSPYALYDNGKLYLNTKYTYKHGSATSCGNGYVTMSDEIDLSNFKSVESVEVV